MQLKEKLREEKEELAQVAKLLSLPPSTVSDPTSFISAIESLLYTSQAARAATENHTLTNASVRGDIERIQQQLPANEALLAQLEEVVGLPLGSLGTLEGPQLLGKELAHLGDTKQELIDQNHELLRESAELVEQQQALESSMQNMMWEIERLTDLTATAAADQSSSTTTTGEIESETSSKIARRFNRPRLFSSASSTGQRSSIS
jgi:hypothetical protein